MSKTLGFALFTAGAITGSVVTWRILKNKYEEIVQEEIQSVKDAFKKKKEDDQEIIEKQIEEGIKEGIKEHQQNAQSYKEIIEKEKYFEDEFETDEDSEEDEDDDEGKIVVEEFTFANPFVISPEEFSEREDFKAVSLSYFADGKVADDFGNLIDLDDIGRKNLNYIGDYEEDCVHIRNIKLKTDYEILVDPRRYSEVYKDQY